MLLGSIDAIGVMLTERERGGCFVKARRMFIVACTNLRAIVVITMHTKATVHF